ncbi:MAG: alpha/beta fold hydrolase [Anaerolineae bacterium]
MQHIVLDIVGNSLAIAEYGNRNGYPILIQHGIIASIKDHRIFQRLERSGARVICIARPGYGESSPLILSNIAAWGDLVALLVDELHLEQFDVLGMSSGASYGYAIAKRFPERARNIYIYSGIPALYDAEVAAHWPYPIDTNASIADMQKVAREYFFKDLTEQDLRRNEIKDSMMNDCFGIAQDLRIRCRDWGFELADIKQPVYMQHSRYDNSVPFITAEMTSKMLPNCRFAVKDDDVHFSPEALDEFIAKVILRGHQDKSSSTESWA